MRALALVLCVLFLPGFARADEARDRRAKAALALAGAAAPAAAPPPRAAAPRDYPTAYAKAAADGVPLVVYVGCKTDHPRPPAGALLARADALPGVDGPAAVVLYPVGKELFTHATLPCPIEEGKLDIAVQGALKKLLTPPAKGTAAPRPLTWEIGHVVPDRDPRDSVVRVRRTTGSGGEQGTGTVVRSGGGWSIVLTAAHVADGPGELTVRGDGKTHRATLVESWKDADLAAVYVAGVDLPAVRVSDDDPAEGDEVQMYGLSSVYSRGVIREKMTLNGVEQWGYGEHADSESGDSGAGVFAGTRLVGVHLGKTGTDGAARPRACAAGPVRQFLGRVLADGPPKAVYPAANKPAAIYPTGPKGKQEGPVLGSPVAPVPAGALRTTSGRILVPTGSGAYRYADDEGRPTYLPACPSGRCPQR